MAASYSSSSNTHAAPAGEAAVWHHPGGAASGTVPSLRSTVSDRLTMGTRYWAQWWATSPLTYLPLFLTMGALTLAGLWLMRKVAAPVPLRDPVVHYVHNGATGTHGDRSTSWRTWPWWAARLPLVLAVEVCLYAASRLLLPMTLSKLSWTLASLALNSLLGWLFMPRLVRWVNACSGGQQHMD
jgi:hypothetical protein